DAQGTAASLEAPWPLTQVMTPPQGRRQINCVNLYQLPALHEADHRTLQAKCNAKARSDLLHGAPDRGEDRSLAAMHALLQHHGEVSICRHGTEADPGLTEYSFIGVIAKRELHYRYGKPCEGAYHVLAIEGAPHA